MKTWIRMLAVGLGLAAGAVSADAIDNTCATCARRTLDSLNTIINPIRVNQVGYRTDDPHKEAFVAGDGLSSSTSFRIIDSAGTQIYSGKLTDIGTYPYKGRVLIKGYYNSITQLYQFSNTNDTDSAAAKGSTDEHLWRASFGDLQQEGNGYRLVVGSDTSAAFDVRMTVYNDIFETSLKFFGWQRSGDNDSWSHGASHMKDGSKIGHDLTGGWYDCGDYFKVGQTDAYAFTNLILTYTLWPQKAEDRYGSSYNDTLPFGNDGIPDILREAKIGADYVMKLYRASDTDGLLEQNNMYIQVGVWNNDHQYWDRPENADVAPISKGGPPRPVDSAAGSAVPAQYAGSLAMFAKAWEPFDPDYAKECLNAAKDIYKRVVIPNWNTSGYSNSMFYTVQGRWDDDLAWAATGLWYATGDTSYKYALMGDPTYGYNANAKFNVENFTYGFLAMSGSLFSPGGWPMDYQNTFIHTTWALWDLFYRNDTLAAKWGISASEAADVRARLKKLVGYRYAGESTNGSTTYAGTKMHMLAPYDLVWSSITWGMNRYNMGSVIPLVAYHEMIKGDSSEAAKAYWNVVLDNMNYNLGKNPWDISFLMGAGSKNLQHPHNRIANPEGYNAGGIPYAYRSPKGALMGGAVPGTLLRDEWEKYDVTETCIDFSAQMMLPSQYLAEDLPADTTGPVFSNVTVVRVTDTSAIISWSTNELSRDTLFYSLTPNGPVVGYVVASLAKNKTVTITGLSANLTYYFWFHGMDIYRNTSVDDNRGRDYSFTTTSSGVTPKIHDVKACNIRANKATVFWWTDIPATSEVDYYPADTPSVRRAVTVDDEGLAGRFHKVTLTGLAANTTYRYKVLSDGAEDDSSGAWYSFTTTVDIADYTVQIKATNKNGATGSHFYLEVANEESRPYVGLQLRFYFQADAATASKIVVHSSDDAIFDVSGTMSASGQNMVTFGSATAVTGMSGYYYIPITINDTLPVAGRARIEMKIDDSNWGAIPLSTFTNAWSLVSHSSPVAFDGVDLTHLWSGPDEVETYNGAATVTYVKDPYIAGYYEGVHIFGYPPDGVKPKAFRYSYFNFDGPAATPATSVWQDSLNVHFLGRTWSLPDVNRADWQVDGPALRDVTKLAGRTDSVEFVHDTTEAEGTVAHEFAFWGDRDSAYCSCAWQRYIVETDTMTVPPRKLSLRWSASDTLTALTGDSRQSLTLSLLDSTGNVLDTTVTVSVYSLKGNVQFWTVASNGAATNTVTLRNGTATVWISDTASDTLQLVSSASISGSAVTPASLWVAFTTVPPRRLTLTWTPVGPVSSWSGNHRESGILTLTDSAGVLDTAVTVSLTANAGGVHFWNAASGGDEIATVTLRNGVATVWFSDSSSDTASLTASSSIPGSAVTPAVLTVYFQAPPPWPLIDSAWTADSLCSGSPTAIVVALSSKLSGEVTAASVTLGDTTFSISDVAVAADSVTVTLGIPAGAVSGTDVSGSLGLTLHVKDEVRDTTVKVNGSVLDRIGPVLVRASVLELEDGQTQDTVYLKFSEAVTVGAVPVTFPNLGSVKLSGVTAMDTSGMIWRVLVDPESTVTAGTRAGAGSTVTDLAGNAPQECSPLITVVQQWRPVPIASAAVLSFNDDGRADSVIVRFRRKMRMQDTIAGLEATWGTGKYRKTASAISWKVAEDSLSVTGRFDFTWGATSGDAADRSGTVGLYAAGALVPEYAALMDSVGPVLLAASLSYSSVDGVPDTLWLDFSENVKSASSVVALNRDGGVLNGELHSISGARAALLIYADSLGLSDRDSLRAAPRSLGGITDEGLLANETAWRLAPIDFGKRPPVFTVVMRNPVLFYRNWDFTGTSSLRALARSSSDTTWSTLSGEKIAAEEAARILGLSLTANECFDGFVIIYDHLGTYVASMDLSELHQACVDKTLPLNSSGRYTVWLAWDGRSASGVAASTGVYTMRLVTRRESLNARGDRYTNQLYRFGWKRW